MRTLAPGASLPSPNNGLDSLDDGPSEELLPDPSEDGLPTGFQTLPMMSLADAMHRLIGPALGKHVVLEVDGERVEGVVAGVGSHHPDGDTAPSCWYVEIDGTRYTVSLEDVARLCGSDGE
jgi:hypothetical protein